MDKQQSGTHFLDIDSQAVSSMHSPAIGISACPTNRPTNAGKNTQNTDMSNSQNVDYKLIRHSFKDLISLATIIKTPSL